MNKYNQILLSILGTLLVLALLFGIGGMIYEWNNSRQWNQRQEVGIASDENVATLAKDSLRRQIISFQSVQLIDTSQQLYLIPVGTTNLPGAEHIEDGDLLGLTNSFSVNVGHYYTGENFNNLLLYEGKTGESVALFEERVNISELRVLKHLEEVIVVLFVNRVDSNRDGFLTRSDMTQLVYYKVNTRQRVDIPLDGRDFRRIERMYPTNQYIIYFGVDKNQDGLYEYKSESQLLYRIDFVKDQLEPLILGDKLKVLQGLLEGTEVNQ